MAGQAERTHPCEGREAFPPWRPDHLYIGDEGQVLCGRCMGVESTYTPWAWSDLGPMDANREVKVPPELAAEMERDWPGLNLRAWRCEIDPQNRFTH